MLIDAKCRETNARYIFFYCNQITPFHFKKSQPYHHCHHSKHPLLQYPLHKTWTHQLVDLASYTLFCMWKMKWESHIISIARHLIPFYIYDIIFVYKIFNLPTSICWPNYNSNFLQSIWIYTPLYVQAPTYNKYSIFH